MTIGVFVLGGAEPAAACSCEAAVQDERAFTDADAVFTGTLVRTVTPTGNPGSSADPEHFVFDVDEVFKGDVSARQTIVTARSSASCGLEISGRGPFVVFAYIESTLPTGAEEGELYSHEEGELYSHLCSGTRPLSDGDLSADLAAGSRPLPAEESDAAPESRSAVDEDLTTEAGTSTASLVLAGVGVLAVLVAAGVVAGRIRRSQTR